MHLNNPVRLGVVTRGMSYRWDRLTRDLAGSNRRSLQRTPATQRRRQRHRRRRRCKCQSYRTVPPTSCSGQLHNDIDVRQNDAKLLRNNWLLLLKHRLIECQMLAPLLVICSIR